MSPYTDFVVNCLYVEQGSNALVKTLHMGQHRESTVAEYRAALADGLHADAVATRLANLATLGDHTTLYLPVYRAPWVTVETYRGAVTSVRLPSDLRVANATIQWLGNLPVVKRRHGGQGRRAPDRAQRALRTEEEVDATTKGFTRIREIPNIPGVFRHV